MPEMPVSHTVLFHPFSGSDITGNIGNRFSPFCLTYSPKYLYPLFEQNHPDLHNLPFSPKKYMLFANLHQSILAPPQYITPTLAKVLPVVPAALHRYLVT